MERLVQIAFVNAAVAVAGIACAGPAESAPKGGADAAAVESNALVTASLLETTDTVAPGQDVVVLLRVSIADGWHTYWKGQSETGFPLKPKWSLPDGWSVVGIEWPVPQRHVTGGDILDHVYEKQATLVVTLKAASDAVPGSKAKVAVDVAWLACKDGCVPGHAAAELELGVAQPGVQPTARHIDEHMAARAALATPLRSGPDAKVSATLAKGESGWEYTIAAKGAARIRFYPGADCAAMPALLAQGDVKGPEANLRVDGGETAPRVQGIIQILYPGESQSGKPGRVSSFSVDTAVAAKESEPATR